MLSNFAYHKQLSNLRPLGEQSSWTPRSLNEVPRGLNILGSIMCQNLTRLKELWNANFQKDWTNLFFVAKLALFYTSNQCAFTYISTKFLGSKNIMYLLRGASQRVAYDIQSYSASPIYYRGTCFLIIQELPFLSYMTPGP